MGTPFTYFSANAERDVNGVPKTGKEVLSCQTVISLMCSRCSSSAASAGIGAATVAPDAIKAFVKNAAINAAVAAFAEDFEDLCGKGKTMANL